MTTITNSDIPVQPVEVQVIDRLAESRGSIKPKAVQDDNITILSYSSTFTTLVGTPTSSLLLSTTANSNNPFFHEACVYLPDPDELYVTSNLLQSSNSSTFPTILISRINFTRSKSSNDISKLEWAKLRPPPGIEMPNGGVNYKDGLLFCAQGGPYAGTGGLYYMPRKAPPKPIITNFYGRDFNSVNDVVVSNKDGSIWFTDPTYGFEQGFRRKPELPNQVYRFDVNTGECRVVADGFLMPNGLCFSPGEDVLYVTDSGMITGNGTTDLSRPATIYAFDIIQPKTSAPPQSHLLNKRTFAFAAQGIPDGIKCDVHGNVYSGCGDGVEVWDASGSLIGRIVIPGNAPVSNFCFGKEGEMFLCGEQRLWRVQLNPSTKGDLLGI